MPNRLIAGQATKMSRTIHDIRYDEVHDEFLIGNPFAQAILVFRGGANGEEAPIRVIQGPHTELRSPERLAVDPIHDEIFIPEDEDIGVYPRAGNGDVAPIRTLHGSNWSTGALAVDPVHNLIVASGSLGKGRDRKASLLIFNRTDSGEVSPRAVISGLHTGIQGIRQVQVYPKNGWIIISQTLSGDRFEPGAYFVGIWNINDSGDVPPRWKIGGPRSALKRARGVVLDPAHKEIIVGDMLLNAVMTYYCPEIF